MKSNKFRTAVSKALAAATMMLIVTLVSASGAAAADTYKILHTFTWAANPSGGLIFDAAGNLYGTTDLGAHGYGVVFKLKPNPDGTWTETTLHSFSGPDGAYPWAGLTLDAAGNLNGTTLQGGAYGYGTVFKLKPNPDGSWTESVLHSFAGGDGGGPTFGSLIFDAAGSLYGATEMGGAYDEGVVFRLTPNPDGTWTESVLHSFTGGDDGGAPFAPLIFDAAGNLYGATVAGGCHNNGVVFKLTPNPDGTWKETVLHTFYGIGRNPQAGVILDAAGNLYGTTYAGNGNNGLVFEITP